ncbi:PAS domain S-box-containing protein [Klenkia soli]|uniref:PAS domain S-box-containing protein n=1 Tax=Klenkia soli TaxID=1052260 RepID=A0A1H0P170_9ACTN|nr:EAL domain-containing protein [Klenkia soli]SDO98455.1 PAS domain S-box-containing protein [Klenkia soli]
MNPEVPGAPPMRATPRRVAVGAVLLCLGIAVSATWPAPASDIGVAACAVVAFLGAAAWALPAARRSSHPAVWGWYVVGLVVAGAGAALALHVPGSVVPMTMGALPGLLLTVLPLLRLIPVGTWRQLRGQLVSSLLLFLVSCLLCALAAFELVSGRELTLDTAFDATLVTTGITLALLIAMGLLVVSSTAGELRRVAVLALFGQVAINLALVLMAFSDEAHGTTPPLVMTAVCATVGLSLLLSAALLDTAPPTASPADTPPSLVAALLPHLTALGGGLLLLLGVLVHDRLGLTQTALAGLGLVLLVVLQTVSWRDGRDLTRRLQRSEAYFRAVVRSAVDPVVILDGQLTITWTSPGMGDILGREPGRLTGRDVRVAVHPDDRAALTAALLTPQTDRGDRTTTARVRREDGTWRLVQGVVRDLRQDPDVGALVLYCRDITRTDPPAQADAGLRAAVGGTDPDTGLPDRSALVADLAGVVAAGARSAVVKVWVTGLADAHRGTAAPADVVAEVAGRFSRVLRTGDRLFRTGPQEFAVLLEGTISDAETLAHRLVSTVGADVPVLGLRLSASAGATAVEAEDHEPVQVLRRAAMAMASARTAGPGRVRRHSVAALIAANRQEALRADLSRALDRGELRLVYQPVVDLALQRAGSVEALLRWQHPVWGAISPAEFIPLAEESTLVTTLGRWILHTATAAIAALDRPDLSVAVNVAARHVRSGQLLADVRDALAASGLPGDRLVLELTESVLLDEAHVTDDLEALRRLGVRIAVDDFGTGWSSLAYLVGLPIDVLKMDRQFLASVESGPRHQALCRSVLHLGTSLDMDVVVEGVETARELQLLRDMGHRFVQGFLLARPTELERLEATLDTIPVALLAGAADDVREVAL